MTSNCFGLRSAYYFRKSGPVSVHKWLCPIAFLWYGISLVHCATMLQFLQLSLRRGPRLLFSEADVRIHPGQRVGITGANGCGKSSLFALIRGELHADSGDVQLPPNWVIAEVRQETPATDRSAMDYVLDGDSGVRRLQSELAKAEAAHDGHRLGELHAELEAIGGYQAESRAGRLLYGLGFRPGEESRPVNSFSGGWRMRLNLAQALMCRSDLLLLDEPTNHLDLEAVLWLESWLRGYGGTLLLISHDRDFLDAVVTQVAHIEQGRLDLYSGNYSDFEQARAERLAQQQANYHRQQREVAHIQSFVDRFKAKATKARQAQSRLKMLERMQRIAPAHVDSPFHFQFRAPEKNPNPLLSLEQADLGYEGQRILKIKHLVIDAGLRVGLLGPNGAGKSTLVKALSGDQRLLAGVRTGAKDLRIGYFAQHQLDQLHGPSSPLEHLQRLDGTATEQSLRNFLGGFGFVGDRVLEPVAPFSGGEKSRLVLALLVYQRPNLLLLDEPTNHLDLEMRQALALALQEYEGAMLLVSHDRHLLRSTVDELWIVADAGVTEFDQSLEDYPAWLAAREKQSAQTPQPKTDRKARKRQSAEVRQRLQPLTRRLKQVEKEMDVLSEHQAKLDEQLADPVLYGQDAGDKLKVLAGEKKELEKQRQQLEEEWILISEEVESLEGGV